MSTLRLDVPISCQEVQALLPRMKTLDAEKRGRVKGHLDRCQQCSSVLMVQAVPAERREKEVPPASLLKSARGVMSAYFVARRGVSGLMWDKLIQLVAQGEEWAKEKLDEGRERIKRTMMLWQLSPAPVFPPMPIPVLGAATEGIAAEVMDETWQPQNKVVPFEVKEEKDGPRVTADGCFTLTVHTPETQWQGAQVVCTLLLVEGQRVSFESVVQSDPSGQGGQVRFSADGLPQGMEVPVPLELVQLYLLASNGETR